jgi:hypothetical protein
MGRRSRKRPARLPEKLRAIRGTMSQDEIIVRMRLTGELVREEISAFELDKREPPLPILLRYGDFAGVYVDALIDDDVDLPSKLPASPKSPGIPHKPASKPRAPKSKS